MKIFTVRDAEAFTMIKAHTLRIWEQRFVIPFSTDRRNRLKLYSAEEMKLLLRISYLIKTGIKVSQISKLPAEEIANLTVRFHPNIPRLDSFYNQLLETILDLDLIRFKQIILQLQEQYPQETILQEVLIPISIHLEKVNIYSKRKLVHVNLANQWINEYICFCTEFLPKQFNNNMQLFILFTPESQKFETNLLYLNYLLRKHSVQTIYLGSRVNIRVITELLERFPHASLCFDLGFKDFSRHFRNYIDDLQNHIYTGGIFYCTHEKWGYYANLPKKVYEFKTIHDILNILEMESFDNFVV